jgi:hypothetical protein
MLAKSSISLDRGNTKGNTVVEGVRQLMDD